MSLQDHLRELRRRGLICAIAVIAGATVGWFLTDTIWQLLREPIGELPGGATAAVNYPTVVSAFDLRIQMAVTVGIALASPVWLFQVFSFIVPALGRRERRYAFGFVGAAFPLFLAGAAAGWFVVPHIVQLMLTFVPSGTMSFLDAKGYAEFILKLMIVTGIAFVIPVLFVLLNFLGVVSGRGLVRAWRWALVGITAFTAIATPAADVLSMFLLAIPMFLLYVAACGIALIHDRRIEAASRALLDSVAVET